jgi:hypothetical protein
MASCQIVLERRLAVVNGCEWPGTIQASRILRGSKPPGRSYVQGVTSLRFLGPLDGANIENANGIFSG